MLKAKKVNRGNTMKTMNTLLVLLLFSLPAFSQSTYSLSSQDSRIVVKGTSSVHDWESEAEKFEGQVSFTITDNVLESIESLEVTIDAGAVKSGKRIMDNKTKDALDAKKNPDIIFSLSGLESVTNDSVTVSGTLTLAGVTKDITLTGGYSLGADGSLNVSGVQPIDMEVYGIDPPTAMMGALKTGKDVEIEYSVKFVKN
jgi:polyisoprenoid-binding protein YceI